MAGAEVLKNAHETHDGLKVVDEQVKGLDKEMQSVNTKMEGLNIEARYVGDTLQDINDIACSAVEGESCLLTKLIISRPSPSHERK